MGGGKGGRGGGAGERKGVKKGEGRWGRRRERSGGRRGSVWVVQGMVLMQFYLVQNFGPISIKRAGQGIIRNVLS